MANKDVIDIIIGTDGTVEIDQLGGEGKSCVGEVDDLIQVLGVETQRTKPFKWLAAVVDRSRKEGTPLSQHHRTFHRDRIGAVEARMDVALHRHLVAA